MGGVNGVDRADRPAKEDQFLWRLVNGRDNSLHVSQHPNKGRRAARHSVASIFCQHDVVAHPVEQGDEIAQIIADYLAIAVKVDDGPGVRMVTAVITG